MVSDIEFLEELCERMQQVGLVQSKADFSTRMLGKGPSYLTSMSARDRKVPDEVVAFLVNQVTRDIEDEDVAIFILSEQLAQRQRDQLHRNDLLGWIKRDRALRLDNTMDVVAQQRTPTLNRIILQKLAEWLSRWGSVMSNH